MKQRIAACCVVLAACCLPQPLAAQTEGGGAVTIQAGKQTSREVRTNTLHLFGGRTTELTLQCSGLSGPAQGRRVTLLQVAGKLAVPLGTVHEDAGGAAEQPLRFPLTIPEVTQPADFQLAVSVRRSKDGAWTLLDTVKIKAYPVKFFASAAGGYGTLFDFALLDPAGQLQQLFSEAGIPFADLSGGQALPQQAAVPGKAVLAICVLPAQADAKIEQDVAAIKELTDYAILFKERSDELSLIRLTEKEPLFHVQADISLLDDVAQNPRSQSNAASLIDLVFNHVKQSNETKGAK